MPAARPASARRRPGNGITVEVGDRPVAVLEPLSGRVRVSLVWHPLDRRTDVSGQPGAVVSTLRSHATEAGQPIESVEAAARDALSAASDCAGGWRPSADTDLLVALGGVALPLLGASYDAGAAPVTQVAPWARPVLAAPDARSATRLAFGAKTTRPLVRALVACLSPGDTPGPAFGVLALALVGAAVLSPDALARVLSGPRADHPDHHLPDPATIHDVSRLAIGWGPVRAERVLADAARRQDGLDLLVRTARYQRSLMPSVPQRLPNDLQALHDLLRSRVATAPPPRPRPQPAPPVRRRAAPAHPPAPAPAPVDQHRIYRPPAGGTPVTPTDHLAVPAAARALHGTTTGDLEWIVPRTAGDLTRWGRILGNCLGDYGPAASAGRATILGLLRDGQLRYAIEITPDRAVRQMVGPANRAIEPPVRRAILRALAEAGLIGR